MDWDSQKRQRNHTSSVHHYYLSLLFCLDFFLQRRHSGASILFLLRFPNYGTYKNPQSDFTFNILRVDLLKLLNTKSDKAMTLSQLHPLSLSFFLASWTIIIHSAYMLTLIKLLKIISM